MTLLPSILHECEGKHLGSAGHKVNVKALDQTTIQRCKERVVWSAESQASLADLECRVDESVDRAAAGKVCLLDLPQLECLQSHVSFRVADIMDRAGRGHGIIYYGARLACLAEGAGSVSSRPETR